MEDRGSQGRPMTATEKAKRQDRPPVGGAPPINLSERPGGGVLQKELLPRTPQERGVQPQQGPQGMPFAEAIKPPEPEMPMPQSRSPEEIKADMESFSKGVRSAQQEVKEDKIEDRPTEPPADPASTEEDDSWYQYSGSQDLHDVIEDILNNKKRRAWIEKQLEPMSVTDLIVYGEVHQKVTIIPNKLVVTYRTTSGAEDLEIKKLMYTSETGSTRYIVDKYSLMNLAISLYSINDKIYPKHLDDDGDFVKDMFEQKFKRVLKLPSQLLADLVCNYIWFDERVRKLLVAEELGNG